MLIDKADRLTFTSASTQRAPRHRNVSLSATSFPLPIAISPKRQINDSVQLCCLVSFLPSLYGIFMCPSLAMILTQSTSHRSTGTAECTFSLLQIERDAEVGCLIFVPPSLDEWHWCKQMVQRNH